MNNFDLIDINTSVQSKINDITQNNIIKENLYKLESHPELYLEYLNKNENIDIIDNCIRYNIFKYNKDIKYMKFKYYDNDNKNIELYNYLCRKIDIIIMNMTEDNINIIRDLNFIIYNLRENGICIIKYIKNNNEEINKIYNILLNQFEKILIYRPKQYIYNNDYYILCINYKKLINIEILDIKNLNNEINQRHINNIINQLYHISNWYYMNINISQTHTIKKRLREILIKKKIINILKNI